MHEASLRDLLEGIDAKLDRIEHQQTRTGDTMVPLVNALNNNSLALTNNTSELKATKETFSKSTPNRVVFIIVTALVIAIIIQTVDRSKFNNVSGTSPVGSFQAQH